MEVRLSVVEVLIHFPAVSRGIALSHSWPLKLLFFQSVEKVGKHQLSDVAFD